jgi:hypothetical protein
MKNVSNIRHVAAALLMGCVAGALTYPAHAEDAPATSYTPFIPITFPIFALIKPIKASCALATSGPASWSTARDVLVRDYPGASVDSVKMRYGASVSGNYSFRIVIRENNRSGHVVTKSETKTVYLTAGSAANVESRFANSFIGFADDFAMSHEDVSGPGVLYFAETSASSCSDTSTTASNGTSTTGVNDIGFEIRGDSNRVMSDVVEYRVLANNKYFITGRADEKALLDSMPTSFVRTGETFRVPSKFVYGNTSEIYRFFAPAAVTHAYVNKADRDMINAIPNTGLNDEGADFATIVPDASGSCPTWAPQKIYRSFRNSSNVLERNHRYTTNLNDYNAMTFAGWTPEGVAMCAMPPLLLL